ncbi:hypothetical protein [Modestobacter marinus]|nr:hypothetical protein [Modestobacter marinus]
MELVQVDHGSVTFTCHPEPSHFNPIGAVHGGLVCLFIPSTGFTLAACT